MCMSIVYVYVYVHVYCQCLFSCQSLKMPENDPNQYATRFRDAREFLKRFAHLSSKPLQHHCGVAKPKMFSLLFLLTANLSSLVLTISLQVKLSCRARWWPDQK